MIHLGSLEEQSSSGIAEIEEFVLGPAGEAPYDHLAPPIEEVLADLASGVSEAEWDKLPKDLTDNLDNYPNFRSCELS